MEAIIVALVGAISIITQTILNNKHTEKINEVSDVENRLNDKIEKVAKENKEENQNLRLEFLKTNLTDFLSDLEKNIPKTQIQKIRVYEMFEEYQSLGGNSYIHDKWYELRDKGLI